MRKKKLFLSGALVLSLVMCSQLTACGQAGNQSAESQNATVTPEATTEPTAAPTAEPTVEPTAEPTAEPMVEPTAEPTAEPTTAPTATPTVKPTEAPEEVWVPKEAPAVRNELSEEEKQQKEQEILNKGTFLHSAEVNQGYYPGDISWLTSADENDILALIYACDDVTHGGWGVLGLAVDAGAGSQQLNISAMSDEPDKERLLVYTVKELMELAGAKSAADFKGFSLGAWNGGRIAGLYYLPQDVAKELTQYQAEVAEMEQIIHTYTGELSNENAIESAQVVYDYLQETFGNACLTGQMESTWMGSPDYEMNFIKDKTGKLPAIRGLDFMHNDFAGVTKRAKEWWEQGGIPTICWHTGATFASGYDESKNDNINWEEAFVPGTDAYNALLKGMDRAVPYLQQLEDAGVPILWRPFHELDGGWFWWSKGGSENFVKLWQLMYSRYTDYWGLDNLIWVFGYSGNGNGMADWYPGDDYVDLLGADSYTPGPNANLYEECDSIRPEGMPLVFHECGTIPSEEEMTSTEAEWLFFMVWHTSYLTDGIANPTGHLNEIYNSDYFITLDELPDFQ
ncbi:MAG: hypothetical protein IJY09_01395 [Lachnospiraceae bacterium]|nr:hypothetical protein [Lachnospiraceae bacterium]